MHLPPLRVISIAWGSTYIADFLEYCLPALLAPGNVPVLTRHFTTRIVLVTETKFFVQVVQHPAWKAAARVCDVQLVGLDDLVATRGSYGMSVSYALYRGFEDLGPAMTDCYLLFVNADFILADGSYRKLLPCLLRGDPIVLAPSYCAIAEAVRHTLLNRRDPAGAVLSVPHREMAALTLQNRHFSIRGKTVNQRFFHLDTVDQFYWVANETTLLGRQHPIALVAMKPERHQGDLNSYWDYGVIAEFCPSLRFHCLGDSDDFLMLELRSYDTASDQLSLGWPSPRQIAVGLRNVLTSYTKAAGVWRLALHSGDLPGDVETHHAALDRFVEAVYERLPRELPHHVNHIQWIHHYTAFHEARNRFLAQRPVADEKRRTPQDVSVTAVNRCDDEFNDAVSQFRAAIGEFFARTRALQLGEASDSLSKTLYALLHCYEGLRTLEGERARLATKIFKQFGMHANETSISADIEKVRHLVAEVDPNGQEILAATRSFSQDRLKQAQLAVHELVALSRFEKTIANEAKAPVADKADVREPVDWLRRCSHIIFGLPGRPRPWHWMSSISRHALAYAREHLAPGKDVLVLRDGAYMFEVPKGLRSKATAPLAAARVPNSLLHCVGVEAAFDCCLVDADISRLGDLGEIYTEVRPLLRSNGAMIAFFLNLQLDTVRRRNPDLIRSAFPVCGPARIAWSGSRSGAAAIRLRLGLASFLERYMQLPAKLSAAVAIVAAAPFALAASILESYRGPDRAFNPPSRVTAVAVEIRVG